MTNKIEIEPIAEWHPLVRQFCLTLKVTGRSPRTIEAYELAVRQLMAFLYKKGLRISPGDVSAEHIRMFLGSILERSAPATISQRYRSLKRFFSWLVEEGERTDNPVARIPAPKVPQRNIRALDLDEVRAMLKACDTRTFVGSRDYAMILSLVDTGLRASEFLSMRTSEDNPEIVAVIGKGNKEKVVRLGEKAQLALMRYQRTRQKLGVGARHDALWINSFGRPLTRSGLLRTLKRTGEAAGLAGVYTHLSAGLDEKCGTSDGRSESGSCPSRPCQTPGLPVRRFNGLQQGESSRHTIVPPWSRASSTHRRRTV